MKPQDILFLILFIFLVIKRSPKLASIAGLLFLVFSLPLFSFWIFFTAQRFTWYAAACFFLAVIFNIWEIRKVTTDKIR